MKRASLKHILHIDDEADMRVLVQSVLENLGGVKVSVCDGRAVVSAVSAARKYKPQLILLDYVMSGINGLEILAALRKEPETAAIPVIFISAGTNIDDIDRLKVQGVIGIITKPFDPVLLADQVFSLWDRHHELSAV